MSLWNHGFRPVCKICYGGAGFSEADQMIQAPCKCRGSMGFVHLDCLVKWVNESASISCEVCKYKYHVKIHPKSNVPTQTKALLLILVLTSIFVGPARRVWEKGSPVESMLFFVVKILMSSMFVDWLFSKFGLHNEVGNMVYLDLKSC